MGAAGPPDASTEPSIHSGRFEGVVVVVGVAALGQDSYWAVLRVVDAHGEVHTAVGDSLARFAEAGRRIAIRGIWQQHPKHGSQVRVGRAVPVLEIELETQRPLDVLRLAPRVGLKRAKLLVDHFGEEAVINEIDRNPRRAFQRIAGMPYRHAGEATRWWLKQRRHETGE